MKAVVLAAGEGSRMWPLAINKPKHLLPVGGKPIITNILEALKQAAIDQVFLVVGFRNELIRSALGDGSRYGLQIEYLNQPRWTGTASALKIAYDALGRESFLAVYGDLWTNASAILTVIEKSQDCPRVIGVTRVSNPSEYGAVELKGESIVRILEKPAKVRVTEGWVNTGIYALDGEVFKAIEKTGVSRRAEYELTTSLQRMLDEGLEIKGAIVAREDWMDVGRPWDLLEANERALASLQHRVKGTVEQGAVLKGPIWLDDNSLVRSGSYIEGPVYVGKDCSIGPNARIRPYTCVQDRVTIGASCEIKGSIIMEASRIPHLSYVGDSIIGEHCNLGAGTITANIRFDGSTLKMRVKGQLQSTGRKKLGVIMGDAVQTGINVSILPGVRIGSGSLIGPGAIVSNDVQADQLVIARQTHLRKHARKRLVE